MAIGDLSFRPIAMKKTEKPALWEKQTKTTWQMRCHLLVSAICPTTRLPPHCRKLSCFSRQYIQRCTLFLRYAYTLWTSFLLQFVLRLSIFPSTYANEAAILEAAMFGALICTVRSPVHSIYWAIAAISLLSFQVLSPLDVPFSSPFFAAAVQHTLTHCLNTGVGRWFLANLASNSNCGEVCQLLLQQG